jgi:phosphoribosylaminoimidazole carboxylase (NCAIR synthetase)
LLATTTGYQTRSFGDAAERLGVELVFATDRCEVIEDPWRDQAIAIRFHDEDRSVAAIVATARERQIDGVLVVGDRPTVIAARVAAELGLQGHSAAAAAIARNKEEMRTRLRSAGLPVPAFVRASIQDDPAQVARTVEFPCVLKPLALSGSRGVIRADDPASFVTAFERLRALLQSPEVRAERDEAHATVLIERFIPGREFAIEGVLHHGALQIFAIFDKPDPLDGPFFEETMYITPSTAPPEAQDAIERAVAGAAKAIGLHHGPVHAECRVNASGVFVLEVAARPIGGLCARSLRFVPDGIGDLPSRIALPKPEPLVPMEELLLRHALGEDAARYHREATASGVMMIPIPRRGVLRGVEGIEEARQVPAVDEVRITAKADQLLVPLPEGASYLGFIFARSATPAAVERALREAHARLTFVIDPELPVLTAGQTRYNLRHG